MAQHRRLSMIRHNSDPEPIRVRVLHKWRPFHTKPTMAYLLLDKHGDAIQAMFHKDEEPKLDSKIKVMKCYQLTAYKCAYAPTFNRVAVHAASIEIDKNLEAQPLVDDEGIPDMYFNFLPYDQLSTRLLKNQQLTDYIGRVDDVEHAEVSSSNSVLRLKITTPWTKPVMLALWKEIHSTLDLSPIIDADDDIVVAFTALKVVPRQRDVQLQSTGGTRVIISPQLPIARDMAERFRANRQGTPVAKISLRTVRNLDTVAESDVRTMGHLYQQESGRLKDVHTVETTITDFTSGRGWFFVTCTACNKRIYENNMEYSCSKHRQQHLNYSYSVNCTIEDHTGSANLTQSYQLIKKTPKALPAPEAKDSELLCITDGLPSKARKKLFTDPENDTTDEQQVLSPGVEDSTTKMEPDIAHESIETAAPVEANNSGKRPGLKRKLKQEP